MHQCNLVHSYCEISSSLRHPHIKDHELHSTLLDHYIRDFRLSHFYHLSTLDVTHVRKDTRPSTFFVQLKTAQAWE